MQNLYNKGYNPIVETMNNNYLNTYGNMQNNDENFNQNTQNQQKTPQNNEEITKNNNQNNFNNISGLLNMLGGNSNNSMDLIKNLMGGNSNGLNKNELMMNLLSSLNGKASTQSNKKTTTISDSDFSNLVSIDDYNFVD